TWQFAQNVPHYYVSAIVMTDTLNGWLSAYNYWGNNPGEDGRGFIYSTTDGGATWALQYTTPRINTYLTNLARHYDDVFWVCGYHNTLMKYDPGTGIKYYTAQNAHAISLQITPNPFRTLTEIVLAGNQDISGSAHQDLEIHICNATGMLVKSFRPSPYAPRSTLIWDGRDDRGRLLPSGIYFCTVKAGGDVRTKKVLLIR
ncbi:MAG: T9SS type A sorting domain-containing protein, partial [candidate division WOR-3 bacterium]